jgi:hypothetical protein
MLQVTLYQSAVKQQIGLTTQLIGAIVPDHVSWPGGTGCETLVAPFRYDQQTNILFTICHAQRR